MPEQVKIGSGAFANVFSLDNRYVLKKYKEEDFEDASIEISILKKIKKNRQFFKKHCIENFGTYTHSNIITIKGWKINEKCLEIKLKKYSGNLNDFMVMWNKTTGRLLDIELVKHIHFLMMFGIAEMQFNNIIHGDLKPENILISIDKKTSKKIQPMSLKELVDYINAWEYKSGGIEKIKNEIKIKIIDFNKSFDDNLPLKPLNIQTIYYTPPEIIVGDYMYNNSVDIWTCTCILYEMLTNRHMFNIWNKEGLEEEELDEEESDEELEEELDEEEEERMNHLVLLHQYNYILGKYPEELLKNVKYEDLYFSRKILKGNCMAFENNISNFATFNTFFNEIITRTFKYNYKERLSLEEYIRLYLRTL